MTAIPGSFCIGAFSAFVHFVRTFQFLAQVVNVEDADGGDRLKIRILIIRSSNQTKVFK